MNVIEFLAFDKKTNSAITKFACYLPFPSSINFYSFISVHITWSAQLKFISREEVSRLGSISSKLCDSGKHIYKKYFSK